MGNQIIQSSFTGGEFSPALYSRVDLQKYTTGMRRLRNVVVHPTGGASNRQGTKYISKAKFGNKGTRLISFEYSTTQAYIIEFGDKYCRFFMNGGQIMSLGSPYEIVTPYSESDIFKLKVTQSADILYICHPSYAPRQLERHDHADWELNLYDFQNGPFRLSNTDNGNKVGTAANTGSNIAFGATKDTFYAGHVGALWRVEHDIEGQAVSVSTSTPGTNVTSASIACGGTWRIISHGTWTGSFLIQKSIDSGSNWTTLRKYSSKDDFNINTFGEEDGSDPFIVRINYTLTSGTISVDLTSDPYTNVGIVKIVSVSDPRTAHCDVLKPIGNGNITANWAEGSWSDYRGWPTTCTFYQDRLSFAANTSEPQTDWFSIAGNYNDFSRSNPLQDTDGITINLPARKMNGIKHLIGLSDLLVLTSASEWSINSGGNSGLTPTSITAKVEGYRGSSEDVEPIVIGNRIIYVQRMGASVRDLGFDFGVNGFTGDILNIYSNHLLEGFSIVDMDYQEEPDNLVWFVRSDGKLLSLTYLREQEVLSWAWHDTAGDFKSVATIPGNGYHEAWFVVQRGSDKFIEKMEVRSTSTNPRKHYFLDCGLSYNTPKIITGISKANPGVITSAGHGLNNNDIIDLYEIVGMSELNNTRYKVANKTDNTFTLKDYTTGTDIDTRNLSDYVSGGEIYLTTQTITGLDHLKGKRVTALADGSVLTNLLVDNSGEIDFGFDVGIAHIGLPYVSEWETLNAEMQTPTGTIQGKTVQISNAAIRFENSRGGWIGPDPDHLDEIIQRTDEALGEPTRLYTQDFKVSLNAQYENGARIFFRQVDPLPIRILAFIYEIVVGG